MKNNFLKNKNRPAYLIGRNTMGGFTLLETIVAIFIFTIAMTALLSLIGNSINNTQSLKNEITATYLAEEALDFIRNDRDTIVFQKNQSTGAASPDWDGFVGKYGNPSSLCFSSNGCETDILANNYLQQCLSSGCSAMSYYSSAGGLSYYGLSGTNGKITTFRRKIQFLVPSGKNDQLLVVITITWKNGLTTKTKSYSEILYAWGV